MDSNIRLLITGIQHQQTVTPMSVYDVVDPETGVHYLVTSAGGITPRLGTDRQPMQYSRN